MTDVVFTHFFSTEGESAVIDAVYYSEPEQLLFVELVSGVLAGYKDVPLNVFTALDTINTNRLNGDDNESVGRYWNMWIKPNFTGYDTSDADLMSEADVARIEKLREPVPVDPPAELKRFGVTVWDENEEVNLTVRATDMDDAVARYRQAEGILGWNEAEVLSVTKFFD